MVDVVPPLLKSLMISRSPSLCTPVKLVPPPFGVVPRPIAFWKNQKPCWASPLLSKRSEPKNSTSHFFVGSNAGCPVPPVPFGQLVATAGLLFVGGGEYRAAKLWTSLSLSGSQPDP